VTLPSSSSNISLNAYRNVSESTHIINDQCGQSLSSNSYRLFGNNTVTGNKFKDINGTDLAAVVYGSSTTHTNQTHTWNLGTVCAPGDIVLLYQVTGGGSARSAVTYSAARAKLKNSSGTVTATASSSDIIFPSNEHEGGSSYTDTTAQAQKITATGGENQIQVYFQHSGTIDCTMATVVLKSGCTVTSLSEHNTVIHNTSENTNYSHTFGTESGQMIAPSAYLSVTLGHFYAYFPNDSRGVGSADITARTGSSQYAPSRAAIFQREGTYNLTFTHGGKGGGESYSYNPDQTGYIYYKSAVNSVSKGGGVTFLQRITGMG